MTFLNPLLLFGLAAAAIPIIIHLLNLRKLKVVEFSTLQFLKQLQKTKMRRIKIKQWLLLALRTLLIVSLVMAFSRPALRGSLSGFGLGASSHAKTTMVILLDDSPSMDVRNEHGTFFAQAKDAANHVLGLLKDGDEAYLIRLSEVRHMGAFTPSHAAAPLRSELRQMSLSQETAPFREAFGTAAKLFAESKNFNQELYVITDAQATQFRPSKTGHDTVKLFDSKVRLFMADVQGTSTGPIDNVGIVGATVTSKIITQNKPFTVQAAVRNSGKAATRNAVLSAYLDGARVLQHSLDLTPKGSANPSLSIIPKRRGLLEGYLQLDDDAFEEDNKRYLAVNVPNSIRALCVGPSLDDTRLPVLALTLDKDSSVVGLFAVDQVAENQLSSRDLSAYDVLLLCGLKDFSSGEADRIRQFATAGGGVMIFGGKEMNTANYNAVLFPEIGIPGIQGPRTLAGGSAGVPSSGFLSFAKIEFEHPLFQGLFEQHATTIQPNIESPKVYTSIIPQAGAKGRSIITLSDGTGFLTEYQCGTGRILLCSVEAGLTWSDFPLKGLFVPLLYRSGLYLSQTEEAPSFSAGDEIKITMRLKARDDKDIFVFRSPSGIDERVVPQISSNTGLATFSPGNSGEVGIYELRKTSTNKNGVLLQAVPVNIAPEETDLDHADEWQMSRFFAEVGFKPAQVRQISSLENIDTAILESRFGLELWRYFAGLALLCALLEMAIGRESKRQEG